MENTKTSTGKKMNFAQKFKAFLHNPMGSGIILFLSAVAAFVWANVDEHSYHHFWHEIPINIGDSKDQFLLHIASLHHFVNEFLMAIFFFQVGLEIKREIIAGKLSSPQKAILPIAAALGGMVFPALIYYGINAGTEGAHGWGIPMATDIAFSLGVLALLGSRVPLSLKVFLTALAIVDDLGAVLVIALFYSSQIDIAALVLGLVGVLFLFIANSRGVHYRYLYYVTGIFLVWIPFLESGVHSTIAGVLVAFAFPSRYKMENVIYMSKLEEEVGKLRQYHQKGKRGILHEDVTLSYSKIRKLTGMADNPLQAVERRLHSVVAFFIMPLFALANAGVKVEGDIMATLTHPVALGVAFGLMIGKFVGVYGFTKLFTLLGLGKLPPEITWRHIAGIGFLAGMGFTMSLFVTELAFHEQHLKDIAKTSVLLSSLLAGAIGYFVLAGAKPVDTEIEES